jgi:hypothetical protein
VDSFASFSSSEAAYAIPSLIAPSHNLEIVFVGYDGGAIGRAVRSVYDSLQGQGFPTLTEQSPSEIPSTNQLWETVCRTDYWAAFYVSAGASRRPEDALSADSIAASYNRKDVMGYIWNEALYAPVVDASISANIQLLSNLARVAYARGNGTGNTSSVSGPSALSVLAEPWQL